MRGSNVISVELRAQTLERELNSLCRKTAEERYGKPVPNRISERLERELSIISQRKSCGLFLLAHKISCRCKRNFTPHIVRENEGASLIAFILGIAHTNPLPVHYYCCRCGFTDFGVQKYNKENIRARCGFDLAKAVCPKCGEEFCGDGFDIPFEMFAGLYGEGLSYMNIETGMEIFNEIKSICYSPKTQWQYTVSGTYLGLSGTREPDLLKYLQFSTGVSEECIPFDAESVSEVLHLARAVEKRHLFPPFAYMDFSKKLTGFSDIIDAMNCKIAELVYNENARSSPPSSISTAYCADVCAALINHGLSRESAYRITTNASGGCLETEDISDMRAHNVPQDFIDYLTKAKYLSSRVQIAEMCIFVYKLLWYRCYFPEEFSREFDIYKNKLNSEIDSFEGGFEMSSYNEFECKFSEEHGYGFYEEVEYRDGGDKQCLRSLRFVKIPYENGVAIEIEAIEVSRFCANYYCDRSVEIPAEIMGLPVVSIAESASANTSSDVELSAVKLPKTLKKIGARAFAEMCEFSSVEVPKSVGQIGEYALGYTVCVGADKAEYCEKIDDFKIICESGSVAETYAKQNGFRCELISE